MSINQKRLSTYLRTVYSLDWTGVHGVSHWARVSYWGRKIGRDRGADLEVIRLFALLHDHLRISEGSDYCHGYRAAAVLEHLQGVMFDLTSYQMGQLDMAIRYHTAGFTDTDPTIQSCWDADRLDLWRVGIEPMQPFISDYAMPYLDQAEDLYIKGIEEPDDLHI